MVWVRKFTVETNGFRNGLQGLKLTIFKKCIYEGDQTPRERIGMHGDIIYGIVVCNLYLYI